MGWRDKFVSDIRGVWKEWSTWCLAALAAAPSLYDWLLQALLSFPDLYNDIAGMGWLSEIPAPARWTIRILAAAGLAAKHLRQARLENSHV